MLALAQCLPGSSVVRSNFLALLCFFSLAHSAEAQIRRQSDIDARLAKVAMRFYVAEGPANSCGRSCTRWIAIEGEFDKGSSKRLTEFIKSNNLTALPVFFHSTGGLTDEGINIGRELRDLKMRTGVARTERTCKPADKNCNGNSAQPVAAVWRDENARCSSACVYALIGGSERWVPEKSSVGVHSTAFFCFSEKGQVVRPVGNSKDAIDCRKKTAAQMDALKTFVRDMGISGDLLSLIEKVPNSQMRYLTRDELDRFKINTGEFAAPKAGDSGPPDQ
jgi:hypothetical protein